MNSWHENEDESMNMWKIYTDPNGVAIRTTYGDLKDSLKRKDEIFINRVAYLNYAPDGDDISDENILAITSARPKFLEFEKEIRAMTLTKNVDTHLDQNPAGLDIEVDLQKLINMTVIRPDAARWVDDLLQELHRKCNLQNQLRFSEFEFSEVW